MAITEKDTASSSKVHSAPNVDLNELINELKVKIGKLESECFKKQSIINAYEASEIVSEERMKSLEEDCMNSYRAQTRFTTKINGLKKMVIEEKVLNTKLQTDNEFLKNLISTGNICGILNQVKGEDKYKAVPPPFNNNFMPKVDKEKRNAYLQQFKDVFQDKKKVVDLYKNVEVSEEGEFVMKKEVKEEKSIGVQVSEDDLESIDLNQDDLSDLSDQITEEELKASERGRRYKKAESVDQLPKYPPVTQRMRRVNEQMKREHVSFDICEKKKVSYNAVRPPSKKLLERIEQNKKKKVNEEEMNVDYITLVYPIFSSVEDFDIGEVETVEEYERKKSRYRDSEVEEPLSLKKIVFIKGKVERSDVRMTEFVPFLIDFDNLKTKKTIGVKEPKPSERFKKPKEHEMFKEKVWCRKCDEYGHHTDSCDERLKFQPFHVPNGTKDVQDFVLYKQKYNMYLEKGNVCGKETSNEMKAEIKRKKQVNESAKRSKSPQKHKKVTKKKSQSLKINQDTQSVKSDESQESSNSEKTRRKDTYQRKKPTELTGDEKF
ncbi:uncharacterized protein LOC143623681 [Bidens hawaiensis]|uniref:uncharacterized protein LOC143623681 n=1 Tax=Bidens hawaiensis TaxID=980011 RepID=UPI0040497462